MKFLRKPKIVEAMLYDGEKSVDAILRWSRGGVSFRPEHKAIDGAVISESGLSMATKYGMALAKPKTWVIRGSCGFFYPCSEDDFKAHYEAVKDSAKKCVHEKEGVCTFMRDATTKEAVICDGHDYKCIGHLVDDV